jgi:adenylosuccinate lyase
MNDTVKKALDKLLISSSSSDNHEYVPTISPLDGRYSKYTRKVSSLFSEFALMKARLIVEIEYFIRLSKRFTTYKRGDVSFECLPQFEKFPTETIHQLRLIYETFDMSDFNRIREIELKTNHDITALIQFIKESIEKYIPELKPYIGFVHFGLTSQDINNTAYPLLLRHFITEVYRSKLDKLLQFLNVFGSDHAHIPMLSRTHGQPASPTTVGQQIFIFVSRINELVDKYLRKFKHTCKFGGATGQLNAHYCAYPNIDWDDTMDFFIKLTFDMHRQQFSVQTENYDLMAMLFNIISQINIVLLDLCKDMWQYISYDYFKIEIVENETGSSAMPNKVNPIDFENAEGNLGLANSFFEFFAAKLPITRLQRDLSDSTVLRNMGVPLGHTMVALNSIFNGFKKLNINMDAINKDLNDNWIVVSEGIQTVLRREGIDDAYNIIKAKTRVNHKITKNDMEKIIDELPIADDIKKELKLITPFTYIGRTKLPISLSSFFSLK